jgi:hypothetical protein
VENGDSVRQLPDSASSRERFGQSHKISYVTLCVFLPHERLVLEGVRSQHYVKSVFRPHWPSLDQLYRVCRLTPRAAAISSFVLHLSLASSTRYFHHRRSFRHSSSPPGQDTSFAIASPILFRG